MKRFASLAVALLMAPVLAVDFSGCSSLTPETKQKLASTGSWLLGKADSIALNTIAAAAQSQLDGNAKADWLDSLSAGVRSQAVASFGSEDLKALIGIWTPQKSHWDALGAQLGALVIQAVNVPPAQRAELIAQGIQNAAAELREESNLPTQVNRFRFRTRYTKDSQVPSDLPAGYRVTLYDDFEGGDGTYVIEPTVIFAPFKK